MTFPENAVERIARAMCKAAGEDPDAEVFAGLPVMVLGGYRTAGPCRPAWQVRSYEARAALQEAIAMMKEAEG